MICWTIMTLFIFLKRVNILFRCVIDIIRAFVDNQFVHRIIKNTKNEKKNLQSWSKHELTIFDWHIKILLTENSIDIEILWICFYIFYQSLRKSRIERFSHFVTFEFWKRESSKSIWNDYVEYIRKYVIVKILMFQIIVNIN